MTQKSEFYAYEFVATRPRGREWRVYNENDDMITDFAEEAEARDYVDRHNRRIAGDIAEGLEIELMPTEIAAAELRRYVSENRPVRGTIVGVSSIGVCTVRLMAGVLIPGYSHPLTDGAEYIDLHRKHLVHA